jgi:putative flippase GtrA
VSAIDTVRRHLPVKYRELAKFLVVGGTTYVVDVGLFSLLSHTVLANKPITAKAISVLVATILSYILNREWSFSRRGGREKHHEAMLFFVVNGIALGLNLVPLALSQYVFGFNTANYAAFTVTVANFISANIIGTILGMAFRFWAYRKWVFPEELIPHPELVMLAEAALANDETPTEIADAEAEVADPPVAASPPSRSRSNPQRGNSPSNISPSNSLQNNRRSQLPSPAEDEDTLARNPRSA